MACIAFSLCFFNNAMLKSLHIENYALIRQSDIRFESGFVAITGETGAGKSILLGALGLLLGARADASVLADKERKCIVEAQFDIAGLGLEPLFAEADIDYDETLVLRREISPTARSRAFVNDTPVQLPTLKTLAPHLIDIHSQHQTLTLSESGFRFDLLDAMGAAQARQAYAEAYADYSALKRSLEQLTAIEAQNRREQDYLQFQYDELQQASLREGEQQELEQEQQLLSHAEAVSEGFSTAAIALDDDTDAAPIARLRMAKSAIAHIADFHPAAQELQLRLDSALIELDDISATLRQAEASVLYSPERQGQVDDRLSEIYRLQRKHGVDSVEALIALRDDLASRLQSMATLDDRIHALMEQVDRAFTLVQQRADRLTDARKHAGIALSEQLLPTLHDLGMPEARFAVNLTPIDTYTSTGHDAVLFLFNANHGGQMSDLSRIASGGELSRLMLAIKGCLTSRSLLPTIIFDEIDTGVSGDIASAVGRTLCRMAERMQVVAITHLPQIAARASEHLKVYKQIEADSTISRIRPLAGEERTIEVATMLSTDPPTEAALQTARELMA